MKNTCLSACGLVLIMILQGCSEGDAPGQADAGPQVPLATLEGVVRYDLLGTLPPEATIHVELLDVTDGRDDAPVLASAQSGVNAGSPYRFEIVYDERIIQPQRAYFLAAEVRMMDAVLDDTAGGLDPFAADEIYLSFQAPVKIRSRPMRTLSLQGLHWQLAELDGEAVDASATAELPYIEVDPREPRFAGSAGCNNYAGSYEVNGTSISFGQVVATRKACADGMDLELQYLAMLAKVATWRMENQALVFGDADRNALARFQVVLDREFGGGWQNQ